jgi:hypothetical protein|tara:strand:- start:4663 stop:4890 length:228 start_codon:yes stop_codon:yes gene_type:complete
MFYLVKIWDNSDCFLKKEILYQSDNDVNAMQKASAATPDGCRSTYESIDKEKYEKEKIKKAEEEEKTIIEEDITS